MEIVYSATTDSATFLLDAQGICRWVTAAPGAIARDGTWRGKDAAERCVGAQYVASLDTRVNGGLVDLPRVGAHLVFAMADPETGRIALIRTGPLVRFATKKKSAPQRSSRPPSPAQQSGLHARLPDPYEAEVATTMFRPDVHASPSPSTDWVGFHPPPPPPEPGTALPPPSEAPPPASYYPPPLIPRASRRPYQEAIPTQARIDVRKLDLPEDVHEVRVPSSEAYRGSRFSKRRMG